MPNPPRIIVYATAPKRTRKPKPVAPATAPRIVIIKRKLAPLERQHPEATDAVKDLVRRMMKPPDKSE